MQELLTFIVASSTTVPKVRSPSATTIAVLPPVAKTFAGEQPIFINDKNNIFAKILRKEIPCDKIYEDENFLFFKDIDPKAKIHVLGIPKVECADFSDFVSKYDNNLVSQFFKKTEYVINLLGLNNSGYKIISNSGLNGGQEVPHFHIHILGGEKLNFKL